MGYLFDNVGVSMQSSSAAAGRLESANDFQRGGTGAGARGQINNNFTFGSSKLTADQSATAQELPMWAWIAIGVGVLLVLAKVFKRGG